MAVNKLMIITQRAYFISFVLFLQIEFQIHSDCYDKLISVFIHILELYRREFRSKVLDSYS